MLNTRQIKYTKGYEIIIKKSAQRFHLFSEPGASNSMGEIMARSSETKNASPKTTLQTIIGVR